MSEQTSQEQPTAQTLPRVGILGTGTMGTAVGSRLLEQGFEVTCWNRTESATQPLLDAGATVAASPAAAVGDADIVLTTLFDADAVLAVLQQTAGAWRPGALLVQCATIGIAGTEQVRAKAAELGVDLIEAMMLGTQQPARNGQLVLLVGGPDELVARARPVLAAMSMRVVRAGEVGAGTRLKLACNTWLATLTAGTAQALALCQTWGVDPTLFLEAIQGGQSDSPYAHIKGQLMLDGSYRPAAFKVDGLLKDIRLAADADPQVARQLLDALIDRFAAASAQGFGDGDIAAVRMAF